METYIKEISLAHKPHFPVNIRGIKELQSCRFIQEVEDKAYYELHYVDGVTFYDWLKENLVTNFEDAVIILNDFIAWYKNHFVFSQGEDTFLICGDSNLGNIIYRPSLHRSWCHIDLIEDFLLLTQSPERAYLPIYLSLNKLADSLDCIDFLHHVQWPIDEELLSPYRNKSPHKVSDLNDELIVEGRQDLYGRILKGEAFEDHPLYRFIQGRADIQSEFYQQKLIPFLQHDLANLISNIR